MSDKPSVFARLYTWAGGATGCGVILSVILGGVVGFGLGMAYAQAQAYMLQYKEERAEIEPILASDPAFREVEIHQRSNGGVYLVGNVSTQADLDRLRERIVRVVGEKRASEITLGVDPSR